MAGKQLAGLLLIALALAAVVTASFTGLGEAWTKTTGGAEDVTTTEEYNVWTVEEEVNRGETSVENSWWWSDADQDGTGGISYLRMVGPAVATGLVLTFLALALGAIPKTARGVVPGVALILALLAGIVGLYLAYAGMDLRGEQFTGNESAVAFGMGFYALVAWVVLLVPSAVLGITRLRKDAQEASEYDDEFEAEFESEAEFDSEPDYADEWDEEEVPTRALRCPECGNVVIAPIGAIPTCNECGFHSRS